jgi:hypothetical protein
LPELKFLPWGVFPPPCGKRRETQSCVTASQFAGEKNLGLEDLQFLSLLLFQGCKKRTQLFPIPLLSADAFKGRETLSLWVKSKTKRLCE